MAGALGLIFGAWGYISMSKSLLVALALLALATPVVAGETPKQYCDRVVADADKGPKQALAAGHLYRYGKWQGVKCVKVDYARAFEFYVKAGSRGNADALLKELEYKVNAGMASAKIAIERLEARGYIHVDTVEVR